MRSALIALSCASLSLVALSGCSDRGLMVYNGAPTVTITNPIEGAEVPEGEALFLEGIVNDDGGFDNLDVDWIDSVDGPLAEDVEIERKMAKKGIVGCAAPRLRRCPPHSPTDGYSRSHCAAAVGRG